MSAAPQENNLYDLTLFVACYNEEQGIVPTLDTILDSMREFKLTYEIIIIDDGSKDRSVELIRDYMKRHPEIPIRLVRNRVNMGLGVNYTEAAFLGRGKYYRLVCGDNCEPKETFVTIFSQVGKADLILPYNPTGGSRKKSRRALSLLYTALVNLISGHRVKYYNGLPVTLRSNIVRWHSNSHGFGFQADIVTRLLDLGSTYVEVPVTPYEREGGKSKAFTPNNICSVAHTLLEISIRRIAKMVDKQRFLKHSVGYDVEANAAADKTN